MKASLTKSFPLLHQRSRIQMPQHLPQVTLPRLAFSAPPIGKKTLPLSLIRVWMLMMTWNQPPDKFPLVEPPTDDKLFEGHTRGWDGIDCCAVVAHNQNNTPFKNGWNPQILSYIKIFLHFLPLKWLIIVLLPSTSRAMKEVDIDPLPYGYLLC